jgi:Zn-finger nucleic acid-binding protein
MDCPVCHNAMVTLELAEIEIDHCLACGGIWLDRGELEALIGSPDQAHQAVHSLVPTPMPRERRRRCPLCDKRMDKVAVGSSRPEVLVDRCPQGEGLWFDRGELRQILAGSGLASDSKVQALLKDMFGLDER